MRILRPGNRILTIGNPGLSVISPREGAAAIPWYLAGGVSAANCLAAYQPKGAADYAASKVNLANPGTYDVTELNGTPSFDSADGWTFSDDRLSTGITPSNDQSFSIIVRFSDSPDANATIIGIYDGGDKTIGLAPRHGSNTYYDNGSRLTKSSGGYTSGILCVAGNKGYYNGSAETGTISAGSGSFSHAIQIGTGFYGTSYWWNGKVQAAAIYNVALTSDQVSAITTAMNAL